MIGFKNVSVIPFKTRGQFVNWIEECTGKWSPRWRSGYEWEEGQESRDERATMCRDKSQNSEQVGPIFSVCCSK